MSKTIAILPGGFKPPHAGHFAIVDKISKIANIDKILIYISPKPREGIDANKSLSLWKLYTKNNKIINPLISPFPSPVRAVYDFIGTLKSGDTLLLLQGEKDIKDNRFTKAQEYANKVDDNIKIKIFPISLQAAGISGTKMREMIKKDKKEDFKKYLPKHLSLQEKEEAWNIVESKKKLNMESLIKIIESEYQKAIKKTHSKEKKRVIGQGEQENTPPYSKKPSYKRSKSAPPGFGAIGELSAMSAGAIESGGFIDREEFIEELKLRECIRKIILEEKKEETTNKSRLKNHIEKLLNEIEEKNPHSSTGINVLEDLLKKIIPTIEQDYKILTTNKEQRESYRSHLLNATDNALLPKIATGDIEIEKPLQEEGEEEEIEQEKVKVKVSGEKKPEDDEAFIDIEASKGDEEEVDEEEVDNTGRNVALATFNKIEKNIIDSYSLLSDESDKKLFHDYLTRNLELYMDRFEDELQSTMGASEEEI